MYLHTLVGTVLFFAGLSSLRESLARVSSTSIRFAGPLMTGVGGLAIVLYVAADHLAHSGASGERVDVGHMAIGSALAVSGVLVGVGRRQTPWPYVTELAGALAVIAVAAFFLVHSGEAGDELLLHLAIAIVLGLSAVAHVAVVLAAEGGRALRVFSALLLVIGGMLLVLYDAHQRRT